MNKYLLREKLVESVKNMRIARSQKDEYVKELQKICDHPIKYLIECKYESMEYFDSLPPRRMCTFCLLEEDGWGGGYEALETEFDYDSNSPIKKVSRDTLYHHRI
jgi:hypothetical protein